jgi:hypothetical protein
MLEIMAMKPRITKKDFESVNFLTLISEEQKSIKRK